MSDGVRKLWTAVTPRRRAQLLFLLVVVVIPSFNVALLATRSTPLSPLDETQHVDVLRRVEAAGYPRMGERILAETAHDVGCRGIFERRVGTCDAPLPVDQIDGSGYNFQAQQPPGYYVPTALLRQVFRIGPADGFVLTARLTGMVWLVAGLGALWLTLGRFGIGVQARAAVVALVAASPLILHQSSTVNNDAAIVLLGAGAVLGALMLDGRPTARHVAMVSVGVAAGMLVKPTALLAVGALSLVVVTRGLKLSVESRTALLRLLVVAAIPSVVALATVQGWQQVRDARAVVPFDDVMDVVLGSREASDSVTLGEAAEETGAFLGAYDNTVHGGAPNNRDHTSGLSRLGTVLLLAAPFTALLLGGDRDDVFGVAALVVAVVGAIASVFEYHSTYGIEGGAPARYGLVLVPFFAVALARRIDRSHVGVVVTAALAIALTSADLFSAFQF